MPCREACLLPLMSCCQMRIAPLSTEASALAAILKQKYMAGGNFKLSNAVKGAVLDLLGNLLSAYPQACKTPIRGVSVQRSGHDKLASSSSGKQ